MVAAATVTYGHLHIGAVYKLTGEDRVDVGGKVPFCGLAMFSSFLNVSRLHEPHLHLGSALTTSPLEKKESHKADLLLWHQTTLRTSMDSA